MATYISGPMSGIPELNFPAFIDAAERLRAVGVDVVSPTELPHNDEPSDQPWEFYLRHDLKALLDCDSIFMLPGWRKSRGARLEHLVAEKLNFRVFYPRDYHQLGL
jgi:hypothetical protein